MAKEAALQVRMDSELKEQAFYSADSVWEAAIKHKIRPGNMPVSEKDCVVSV